MYIILPNTVDGLDTLIKNINPFILTRHVSLLQKLPVQVTIPMFKFDFTSHLEPILRDVILFFLNLFIILFLLRVEDDIEVSRHSKILEFLFQRLNVEKNINKNRHA